MQWSLTAGVKPSFYLMVQVWVSLWWQKILNAMNNSEFESVLESQKSQTSLKVWLMSCEVEDMRSWWLMFKNCWQLPVKGFLYWFIDGSLFSFPRNQFKLFLPCLCLLKHVWFYLSKFYMKSQTFVSLTGSKQPQSCTAEQLRTVSCSVFPQTKKKKKRNWRASGCLFAYLTSRRLPAH